GISWNVLYEQNDPNKCIVAIQPVVTYPSPSSLATVNNFFYGPGGSAGGVSPGTGNQNAYGSFPLNFKDSCTITWLAFVNRMCRTIDITANWNGLTVQFSVGQSANGVDTLQFDSKDFLVQPSAG